MTGRSLLIQKMNTVVMNSSLDEPHKIILIKLSAHMPFSLLMRLYCTTRHNPDVLHTCALYAENITQHDVDPFETMEVYLSKAE